jgi:hypothetical protein
MVTVIILILTDTAELIFREYRYTIEKLGM